MIQAAAYTDERGMYVDAAEVVERDGGFFARRPGGAPASSGRWARACKNSVTPDEMYEQLRRRHAAAVRDVHGPARPEPAVEHQAVVGVYRLLQRIWRNVVDEETGDVRASPTSPPTTTTRAGRCTAPSPPCATAWSSMRFNTAIASSPS